MGSEMCIRDRYIIAAGNLNEAVSNLLDPFEKIHQLVDSINKKQNNN